MIGLVSIDFGHRGRRSHPAMVLTPRVCVHARRNHTGRPFGGYGVSDPETGLLYHDAFETAHEASTFARALIARFGPDPLVGAAIAVDDYRIHWTAKPAHYDDLREFCNPMLGAGG